MGRIVRVTDPALLAELESGKHPAHPMAEYGPAVRHVESRGNPNAVSPAGAIGADQFMPATAAAFGINPRDPVMSGVARDFLLAENYARFRDPVKALQAYNAGPAAVERAARGRPLPQETANYAPLVLSAKGQPREQSKEQKMERVTDPALIAELEAQAGKQSGKRTALPKSQARLDAEARKANMNAVERFGYGLTRPVQDIVNTAKGLFGGEKNFGDQELNAALDADSDEYASGAGRIVGEIATTFAPGGAAFKLGSGAARLAGNLVPRAITPSATGAFKWVPKAANLAAGGAAAGATTEAMMGRDAGEGAMIGAVAAPAVSAVLRGAQKGYGALRDMSAGAENEAAKRLEQMFDKKGRSRADLVKRIEAAEDFAAAQGLRPGAVQVRPTIGMAADATYPELKSIEEAARRSKEAFRFNQIDANNQGVIRDVFEVPASYGRKGTAQSGGPVPMSPAERFRQQQTGHIYDAAMPVRTKLNAKVEQQLLAPELEPIVRRAQKAQAQEVAAGNPNTPAVGRFSDMNSGVESDFSISELHKLRGELTREINAAMPTNSPYAMRLLDVRDDLTNLMQNAAPDYGMAMRAWADTSRPQNRADVMQVLLNAVESSTGAERPKALLDALRNAPQTIKKAGGMQRFKQVEQILSPEQMEDVNQVAEVLRRKARYEQLDAPSVGTATAGDNALMSAEDMLPPVFSQNITILRRMLRVAGMASEKKINEALYEAATDTQKFKELLERVPPGEHDWIARTIKFIRRNPTIIGGANSAAMQQFNKE